MSSAQKKSPFINRLQLFLLTEFIYSRAGLDSIVIVTGDPNGLLGQLPKEIKLYIVCGPEERTRYIEELTGYYLNASYISYSALTDHFIADKLLLVYEKDLLELEKESASSMLSLRSAVTIYAKKQRLARLKSRVESLYNKRLLIGNLSSSGNSDKRRQYLQFGGKLSTYSKPRALLSVLAIICVYNERDIIESTILHLINEGIDVHIIDNWSDDGSYEKVIDLVKKYPQISYERFPSKPTGKYEWAKLLLRIEEVSKQKTQYDWIMLNDADEIRWSPWLGVKLQQALSFVDDAGFNAVDYTVFNFKPTEEGYDEKRNIYKFFRYGSFGRLQGDFVQVKSWKNNQKADLNVSGGHHVTFPGLRIYPFKFLLCHYPIRSSQQGSRKIFKERLPRFLESEKRRGWHVHYDQAGQDKTFIYARRGLIKFIQNRFYQDYLIERLSGFGIDKDS